MQVSLSIPGYDQLSELETGAVSAVYVAVQESVNRTVALKVLIPAVSGDPDAVELFRSEASAAAALEHPNILRMYDSGEIEGRPYIAMEYVEGEILEAILQRGPTAPQTALSLVRQLAAALDYAHRVGVLHQDVRPANVLVGTNGRALLTNFGFSRNGHTDSAPGVNRWRTDPAYLAPEQRNGDAGDFRCDLYALGLIVGKLFAEELAESGDGTAPLRSRNAPSDLGRVLKKALQHEPADRYQSGAELVRDLEGAVHALEVDQMSGGRKRESAARNSGASPGIGGGGLFGITGGNRALLVVAAFGLILASVTAGILAFGGSNRLGGTQSQPLYVVPEGHPPKKPLDPPIAKLSILQRWDESPVRDFVLFARRCTSASPSVRESEIKRMEGGTSAFVAELEPRARKTEAEKRLLARCYRNLGELAYFRALWGIPAGGPARAENINRAKRLLKRAQETDRDVDDIDEWTNAVGEL